MKNYLLNPIEKERFILNYKIKDNKIIVNFAKKSCRNKHSYVIPYTIENEKKLLQKMKDQMLDAEYFFGVKMKRCREIIDIVSDYSLMGILVFGLINVICFENLFLFCVTCIPTAISSLFFAYSTYWKIDKKIKLNDFKKNQFFLENERMFKLKSKFNKNVLCGIRSNVDEKTNQEELNLNSIHKIKYKELKKLLENIKFEKDLDFEYKNNIDSSLLNCESKVLTKNIR